MKFLAIPFRKEMFPSLFHLTNLVYEDVNEKLPTLISDTFHGSEKAGSASIAFAVHIAITV